MEERPDVDPRPVRVDGAKALDPERFARFLGIASWLMSMSKEHRSLPISHLEGRVLPAILLKQFKIFQKEKMPIAFLSWAMVSDDVRARLENDVGYSPGMMDWRSGPNLVIVECVSPFAAPEAIKQQFFDGMAKTA